MYLYQTLSNYLLRNSYIVDIFWMLFVYLISPQTYVWHDRAENHCICVAHIFKGRMWHLRRYKSIFEKVEQILSTCISPHVSNSSRAPTEVLLKDLLIINLWNGQIYAFHGQYEKVIMMSTLAVVFICHHHNSFLLLALTNRRQNCKL